MVSAPEQDEPALANATAMAADRTQDIARYLQQTDVNDMIRGVEDFARRQPLLFLGGAFAIGLIGSRFLGGQPDLAGGSPATSGGQQGQLPRGRSSYGSDEWRATGPGSYRTHDRLARTGI